MGTGAYFSIGLLLIAIGLLVWFRVKPGSAPDYQTINFLVTAAEQMLAGRTGEEKLNWVLSEIARLGLFMGVDPRILRVMIESAVYWLKAQSQPQPQIEPMPVAPMPNLSGYTIVDTDPPLRKATSDADSPTSAS